MIRLTHFMSFQLNRQNRQEAQFRRGAQIRMVFVQIISKGLIEVMINDDVIKHILLYFGLLIYPAGRITDS